MLGFFFLLLNWIEKAVVNVVKPDAEKHGNDGAFNTCIASEGDTWLCTVNWRNWCKFTP